MSPVRWPDLPLADWRPTRDALHRIARLLGSIRASRTAPHPHWWHGALTLGATALRTGPIPGRGPTDPFELTLDLAGAFVSLDHPLAGALCELDQPGTVGELAEALRAALTEADITLAPDPPVVDAQGSTAVDPEHCARFLSVLQAVAGALVELSHSNPVGFTSPIHFWPHHFDLALSWFSGRLVPGTDPAERAQADEQMTFGFSSGDDAVPEPYAYVTAYPFPTGLDVVPLPHGARWQADPWRGVCWPYAAGRALSDPHAGLCDVWRAAQAAAAELMQ